MLAGTGVWKISSVARGFSSIQIDYYDYQEIVSEYDQEIPQSQTADNPVAPRGIIIISRINEFFLFFVFSIKYRCSHILLIKHKLHLSRLFCCNRTCYCVNMVSVTSAARYITSASRYHQRYQSRSSMYIHGLISRNFAELAEAVPIVYKGLRIAEKPGPTMSPAKHG